ncbi:MAG: hypothetical protein HYX39_14390 [Bacteroidetes bacterium]|nr:hypothetical protein [Bacteroidota bacterium]
MSENKELIEQVLKKDPQDIAFEEIPEENDSPLAQPVVQKNNPSEDATASKTESKDTSEKAENKPGEESKEKPKDKPKEEPLDAPEQEIDAEPTEESTGTTSTSSEESGEFNVPIGHATMMADTILGVVNNTLLEVGAGYFVTIRKHKDFYDFDEVIQVIEEQNVKNIKRIKLDEEDKAMLRPLLIHVLRKKAKVLTPEQQLLGVALSIIIKKAKVVMEIRAENEMLVERIRDIIRKEVGSYREDEQEKEDEKHTTTSENKTKNKKEEEAEVVYEETLQNTKATNRTGLPDSVLETSE